jgi:hypothetical protein
MGIFQQADELGKQIQHEREVKKMAEQAHEEGKQEKEAEIQQHEEDKKQGMI